MNSDSSSLHPHSTPQTLESLRVHLPRQYGMRGQLSRPLFPNPSQSCSWGT